MDNFDFHRPTHYYFGQGESALAGERIKEAGKERVLVVYGGGSAAAGAVFPAGFGPPGAWPVNTDGKRRHHYENSTGQ